MTQDGSTTMTVNIKGPSRLRSWIALAFMAAGEVLFDYGEGLLIRGFRVEDVKDNK